jgi:hypothetical protein
VYAHDLYHKHNSITENFIFKIFLNPVLATVPVPICMSLYTVTKKISVPVLHFLKTFLTKFTEIFKVGFRHHFVFNRWIRIRNPEPNPSGKLNRDPDP